MIWLSPFLAYLWVLIALALGLWFQLRFRGLKSILQKPVERSIGERLPSLSLIICFRNEEENLRRLIPLWAEQQYPDFEVILVDDHSSDGGVAFLQSAQIQYPHLRILSSSAEQPQGKKSALRRGILAAKHECLVFTDADCTPASDKWLRGVGEALIKNDVVLGYGALQGTGFAAQLSDYETVQTALRYWSYALIGKAYMGVGRNLAYRKSAMQAVQALNKHQDLLSGDDDLTLREMAKGLKVYCLSDARTFTYSPAPASLKDWWRQKGRHYSTAWRYQREVKLSLALEGALQLAFWLLLPLAVLHIGLFWVLFTVGCRALLSHYPRKEQFNLVQHRGLAWFWPLFEMVWAFATTLLHLRNLIWGSPKKW